MATEDWIEETLALRMVKGLRSGRRLRQDQGWQDVSAMSTPMPAPSARHDHDAWMDAAEPAAPAQAAEEVLYMEVADEADFSPVAEVTPEAPRASDRIPVLAQHSLHDHGRSVLHRVNAQERRAARQERPRRHRSVKAGAAAVTTAALVFGSAGIAFANAANPLPTSAGTATVNGNGSVTVNLTGTWDWGDINGASPQSDCSKRYGVGWAVDWQDASVPNVITGKTKSGAPITFHVGTNYDGMDLNLCALPNTPDADNSGPTGPWSATHVYPNVAAVPQSLCVNFYDPHGQVNQPSGGTPWPAVNSQSPTGKNARSSDFVAGGPNMDGDNSIQTNSFDPNQGAGFCFTPKFTNSLSVTKSGPATGLPGDQGTYQMVATNSGNAPATGVVITDQLPAGETFVPSPGSTCTASAGSGGFKTDLSCPVGTVGANGGTATVTVIVSYDAADTDGQALKDCASVTGGTTNPCVTTTIHTPNVTVVKSGPTTGNPNGTGTYTMLATNSGTAVAPSAVITDVLPVGESYSSSSDAFGTCTAAGQTVTCPVGDLAASGGHASVTVTVSYGPNTAGMALQDCATVASAGNTSPQSCVTTNITLPKLAILKTGPATGDAGGTGTYTMKASNSGSADGTNVVIKDDLPAGEAFSSASVTCTTAPTNLAGFTTEISCPVGTVAAGGSASITITVSYGANTSGQTLTDCATASNSMVASNQSCVPTVIGKQTIAANIFLCNNGTQSTTVQPGGTLVAQTGADTPISGTSTLGPSAAAVATYKVNASAPANYAFVHCGTEANPITLSGSPATGASQSVAVPAGGSKVANFYVVPTGLTVGVVKTNNAANPSDTSSANAFQQTETAPNPGESFTYQAIITDTAAVPEVITTLTDTLPSGTGTPVTVCQNLVGKTIQPGAGNALTCDFPGTAPTSLNASQTDLVTVGVTNTPGNPPGSATGTSTSTVNTNGQSLTGHIYLCTSGTTATTAEVSGGTIAAAGPVTRAAAANPLATTSVPSGAYTLSATAPTGYTFVTTCPGAPAGTPAATVPTAATTATEPVTVPSGGAGVGIFYVVPNTPGLGVSVIKTNNAADPTGTDFAHQETAAALGETFTYQAVISNSNDQPEVISSITDTLPATSSNVTNECASLVGKTLNPGDSVTCTFSGTAPTGAGDSITDKVTVTTTSPPGTPNPGTATGTDTSTVLTTPTVIITKANNAAGTGFGTSETAADGITSVPYQVVVTNTNAAPGTITVLTDTVNGTTMNICPDLIGDVLQPGQSATCDFTGPVPTTPTTDTAAVTLSVNGVLVTATAPSTVFPPVLATQVTQNPPATPVATTPAPAVVAPAQLAFTGAPVKNLVGLALALLLGGLGLLGGLVVTDPRRRRLALVQAGWTANELSAAQAANPGQGVYSSAKAALEGLSGTIARRRDGGNRTTTRLARSFRSMTAEGWLSDGGDPGASSPRGS